MPRVTRVLRVIDVKQLNPKSEIRNIRNPKSEIKKLS